MLIDDFESDGVSSVNMNCNMVSVLPYEYNQETEIEDNEEADAVEMAKHKPVCYYVLNNGTVEEKNCKTPILALRSLMAHVISYHGLKDHCMPSFPPSGWFALWVVS